MTDEKAKRAISHVGFDDGHGRGFVVEGPGRQKHYVITAAHCLGRLPPTQTDLQERMYPKILGHLGEEREVSAECLFVDPISDLAVLAEPDDQGAADLSIQYRDFLKGVEAIKVAVANEEASARVLSLDGAWMDCRITATRYGLWLHDINIEGGMSGSPILTVDWRAVGVLVVGGNCDLRCGSGPHPSLTDRLPAFLVEELIAPGRPRMRRVR
jgi:S1-C subfamily serine protease